MKKHKQVLLIAIAIMLMLAGCKKEDTSANDAATEAQETEENQGTDIEEAGKEQPAEIQEVGEIRFTVLQNQMETEDYFGLEDGSSVPYAYTTYPSYELPDELTKDYPQLSKHLSESNDIVYKSAMEQLAYTSIDAFDDSNMLYSSMYSTCDVTVVRADQNAVGLLAFIESDFHGAHPFVYNTACMIDSHSGELIKLSDAVTDTDELAQAVLDNLVSCDENYVFSEEENADMYTKIQEIIADDYLVWTLDDSGFHAYFDAYALQYYAFGPIFADLSYGDYPDLFAAEYLPTSTDTPLEERITYEKGKTIRWSKDALTKYVNQSNTENEEGEVIPYMIDCPEWDVIYLADGIFDTLTASPITLTEVSKNSSDYIFAQDWSAATGIALPENLYGEGYADDTYYYTADNSADYGRLALEVYELGTDNPIKNFDFSNFLNTPTPGNEYTTLEIPYAAIYDGVLYTEIAHRTYAEDQPYTGFIVAVDTATGELLWRSDMLVANGSNFVVGEDTIICGYGFTAEDDYLYILSRHSGAVLEKRKLKTGPDYFIPVDDSLYVLTYDTVYEYNVTG